MNAVFGGMAGSGCRIRGVSGDDPTQSRILGELLAASQNVMDLAIVLREDWEFATNLNARSSGQPERRVFVRSLLAFVEGMTHAIRRYALAAHEAWPPLFTEAELAMLREVAYALKDNGEAFEQTKYVPFGPSVRLAIRAFSRSRGYQGQPDYQGQGWQSLRDAALVRNRLMHPRVPEDLAVSDSDLLTVIDGVDWFYEETGKIIAVKPMPPSSGDGPLTDKPV